MDDTKVTVQQLKDQMRQFVQARDWEQFHIPKNLSMALTVEAAELMELFLWVDVNASWDVAREKREQVEHELADVLAYVFAIANACDINVADAFMRKLALNEKKYPVDQAKGRSDKYHAYTE